MFPSANKNAQYSPNFKCPCQPQAFYKNCSQLEGPPEGDCEEFQFIPCMLPAGYAISHVETDNRKWACQELCFPDGAFYGDQSSNYHPFQHSAMGNSVGIGTCSPFPGREPESTESLQFQNQVKTSREFLQRFPVHEACRMPAPPSESFIFSQRWVPPQQISLGQEFCECRCPAKHSKSRGTISPMHRTPSPIHELSQCSMQDACNFHSHSHCRAHQRNDRFQHKQRSPSPCGQRHWSPSHQRKCNGTQCETKVREMWSQSDDLEVKNSCGFLQQKVPSEVCNQPSISPQNYRGPSRIPVRQLPGSNYPKKGTRSLRSSPSREPKAKVLCPGSVGSKKNMLAQSNSRMNNKILKSPQGSSSSLHNKRRPKSRNNKRAQSPRVSPSEATSLQGRPKYLNSTEDLCRQQREASQEQRRAIQRELEKQRKAFLAQQQVQAEEQAQLLKKELCVIVKKLEEIGRRRSKRRRRGRCCCCFEMDNFNPSESKPPALCDSCKCILNQNVCQSAQQSGPVVMQNASLTTENISNLRN